MTTYTTVRYRCYIDGCRVSQRAKRTFRQDVSELSRHFKKGDHGNRRFNHAKACEFNADLEPDSENHRDWTGELNLNRKISGESSPDSEPDKRNFRKNNAELEPEDESVRKISKTPGGSKRPTKTTPAPVRYNCYIDGCQVSKSARGPFRRNISELGRHFKKGDHGDLEFDHEAACAFNTNLARDGNGLRIVLHLPARRRSDTPLQRPTPSSTASFLTSDTNSYTNSNTSTSRSPSPEYFFAKSKPLRPKDPAHLCKLLDIYVSANSATLIPNMQHIKNDVMITLIESCRAHYNPLCQGLAFLREKGVDNTLMGRYLVAQIQYDARRLGLMNYVEDSMGFDNFLRLGGKGNLQLVEGFVDAVDAAKQQKTLLAGDPGCDDTGRWIEHEETVVDRRGNRAGKESDETYGD